VRGTIHRNDTTKGLRGMTLRSLRTLVVYVFLTGLMAGLMLANAILRFQWVYVLVVLLFFIIAGFMYHASAGLIPEGKE